VFAKGRKKGTLRFALRPAVPVRKVLLAGDFNGWQPVVMRRRAGGEFVAIVEAVPGVHEYKFILDGRWETDPDNHRRAANPYGSSNSVAIMD